MAYDSRIESVRIEKLDLDIECYLDILNGNGFRLTAVESFNKKNEKVQAGLQSEFFGTDFGDDASFAERYSCKCKKYIGKMYNGVLCDTCMTEVEFHDADLTKTGWIILDNFKIISPIYAAKLNEAFGTVDGEKVLTKILEVDYYENKESIYTDKELLDIKKHPYMHKGMIWLSENILEVLEHYKKKKPTKLAIFNELIEDSGLIFTSSLPVYSAILRTELPGVKGNKVYKMKMNTLFQTIIRITNFINKYNNEEIDDKILTTINMQLGAINSEVLEIFDETFKELTSKKGLITSKVIGGRYNFSARNIIVPSSGRLRADEIELGYITFMELFRYEIINLYAKLNGCTIMESSNTWKRGLVHPNKILFNLIQHMIADDECKKYLYVIISRNPCINYGSFMCMRIAGVKEDINDKTMTIPSNCLKTTGADFDGDVLNIFRIIGSDFIKRFNKNLNPRYNLYISRMTGRINMDTMPFKDEIVGFYSFNTI